MTIIATADAFISDWLECRSEDGKTVRSVCAERAKTGAVRVEFIGDSYFVGYGNLLPEGAGVRDGLALAAIERNTDCWQSMAALSMRQLVLGNRSPGNLVWRIFARSGRGMVRNYPGLADRLPLSEAYWQRQHTSPEPHLAVINLGTNDFSTPPALDESITDVEALERLFVERYHEFLDKLQQRYPGITLLLVGVPHPASVRQPQLLQGIVRQRSAEGQPISFCQLPQVPLTGCDAHPGLTGHQQCALGLAAAMAQCLAVQVHPVHGDGVC